MVALKIVLQAFVITGIAAAIGIGVNSLKSDGIPLVTDIPYEIFAPCRDSEAATEAASSDDLSPGSDSTILYVDARPSDFFKQGHVAGAVNIPYSALFGASEQHIADAKKLVLERQTKSVLVYGAYEDPNAPGETIDFGRPLAQQLVEAGFQGVKYVEGGLDAVNKTDPRAVKKPGELE